MTSKLIGLLGICEKAGKLVSGELACEKSVKSGKAKLCLTASDASENTRKHFYDMCAYRHIPYMACDLPMEALGHAAGKAARAVMAIEDAGLGESLKRLIEGGM